ncbi:MAG TPA: hypothetical protein VGG09_14450 [Acidimicrobiales bacterium]
MRLLPRGRNTLDQPALLALGVAGAATVFVLARLVLVAHGDVTRFIDVGSAFAHPSAVPRGVAIVPGSGYDGEFYFRLALDPLNLHRTAFGITLDNPYRVQRITYSFLAWLGAGGQAVAVPYSLLAVNVVALAALTWLGALFARACGRRAAWGLLLAGYFGFLFSLGRDLTEICEACFVVAALLLLRRGRPVAAGFVLAAAVLSRETALVVVAGIGVVALADVVRRRRRPGRADAAWLVPLAGYAGWQLIGWAQLGSIPFGSDTENNLTYPFVSVAEALGHNLAQLPSEHAGVWLAQLAVLAIVVGTAGLSLAASRASRVEKSAWVVAVALVVFLSRTLWDSHADFRGFEDVYVLSTIVVLDSDRKLHAFAVVVAAMWVATCVHRVLIF